MPPTPIHAYTDDQNHYLQSLDYGNGDGVEYTYNKQGQVAQGTVLCVPPANEQLQRGQENRPLVPQMEEIGAPGYVQYVALPSVAALIGENIMRKIATIVLVFTTLLLLCSCKSHEYPFPNKNLNVEKIELLYNPYTSSKVGPMETICILDDECADDFMEKLYGLRTSRCTTPPRRNYGAYVARVVYENGDIEMFGSWNIEFVAKGNTPTRVGSYYITDEAFEAIFCEYAGITSFTEDKSTRSSGQE